MKRIAIFSVLLLLPMTALAQPMASAAVKPKAMKPAPAMAPAMTAPKKVVPSAVTAPQPTSKPVSMAGVGMGTPKKKTAEKGSPLPQAVKSGSDPWWKALLGFLSKAGLAFAGALLPVLIVFAVSWLKNKLKLDKIAGVDDTLNKWVEMAITYAEQQASKLDDNPDPNAAKIKLATDFVLKMVKASGLPAKVADLVEDRIEARLKSVKNGVSK